MFVPTGGLEPPIFGLGDRRLIHWATRAISIEKAKFPQNPLRIAIFPQNIKISLIIPTTPLESEYTPMVGKERFHCTEALFKPPSPPSRVRGSPNWSRTNPDHSLSTVDAQLDSLRHLIWNVKFKSSYDLAF